MVELKEWDTAEVLQTPEDVAMYLEVAFEEDDPAFITQALGIVARSEGMTQIAKTTGLTRASLYKALSTEGNPEFATVLKVITALGLKLRVAPATPTAVEEDDAA